MKKIEQYSFHTKPPTEFPKYCIILPKKVAQHVILSPKMFFETLSKEETYVMAHNKIKYTFLKDPENEFLGFYLYKLCSIILVSGKTADDVKKSLERYKESLEKVESQLYQIYFDDIQFQEIILKPIEAKDITEGDFNEKNSPSVEKLCATLLSAYQEKMLGKKSLSKAKLK